VSVRVLEIFRQAGGQITERWGVADRTGLLKQLGGSPRRRALEPIVSDSEV
jgi:hypothetical protein